jgi:hypothetical protein
MASSDVLTKGLKPANSWITFTMSAYRVTSIKAGNKSTTHQEPLRALSFPPGDTFLTLLQKKLTLPVFVVYTVRPSGMVSFMCQLGWAPGCPDNVGGPHPIS